MAAAAATRKRADGLLEERHAEDPVVCRRVGCGDTLEALLGLVTDLVKVRPHNRQVGCPITGVASYQRRLTT